MKKIALAVALSVLMTPLMANAASPVDAGEGTVNFTGSVISAPCSISSETADQIVDLGQVNAMELNDGRVSALTPFSIKLTNCDATVTTAAITFSGLTDGTANDELLTSGTTGTAIQIISGGVPVTFDMPVNLGTISAGDNVLQFGSQLKRAAAATTVTEGDVAAVANFSMVYP